MLAIFFLVQVLIDLPLQFNVICGLEWPYQYLWDNLTCFHFTNNAAFFVLFLHQKYNNLVNHCMEKDGGCIFYHNALSM